MALTGWSTSNYLEREGVVYETLPLMFSAWVYRSGDGTGNAVLSTGQEGETQQRRILWAAASSVLRMSDYGAAGSASAVNESVPDGEWAHVAGWGVTTTRRESVLNGESVFNTSEMEVAAGNITRIGVSPGATLPWFGAGAIGEVSIWDGTGLNETARRALDTLLAGGANPLKLNAAGAYEGLLVAYWPLKNPEDLADASGNGNDMTMVGALTTFGSNPPVSSAAVPQLPRASLGLRLGL